MIATAQAPAKLPARFRHDGFDYTVLERQGDIALLRQSKAGVRDSFEVVIVQHAPDRTIVGKFIPAHEAMPGSGEWGRLGWTFTDIEFARVRLRALIGHALTPSRPRTRLDG